MQSLINLLWLADVVTNISIILFVTGVSLIIGSRVYDNTGTFDKVDPVYFTAGVLIILLSAALPTRKSLYRAALISFEELPSTPGVEKVKEDVLNKLRSNR